VQVCLLREELHHLQESGSYVGEVVKAMGKNKVLVKVIHAVLLRALAVITSLIKTIQGLCSLWHLMKLISIVLCVQVNPEGKYVVDIDKDIDINKCTPNTRVALRNDSYVLHKILPTKVSLLFIWCAMCE
jgi:26S proteasome regulatory subunit T6